MPTPRNHTPLPPEKGLFISFEGLDGVGKTTQLRLLDAALKLLGYDTILIREPGGTDLGERIRDVLLYAKDCKIFPRTELLLFEAARAQLVEEVIRPALLENKIVLCDRFTDSTAAYQGEGRQLGCRTVDFANSLACGGLTPDRTLLFDLDSETAIQRATSSGSDRIESERDDFRKRVKTGFLSRALDNPERCRVIDANGSISEVWKKVAKSLDDLFDLPEIVPLIKA